MSEFKEVWHVWDGNLDATKIIDQNGRMLSKIDFNPATSFRRFKKCGGFNSAVYTTGQKRRRVECVTCRGMGTLKLKELSLIFELCKTCNRCNGKGKVWECKDND